MSKFTELMSFLESEDNGLRSSVSANNDNNGLSGGNPIIPIGLRKQSIAALRRQSAQTESNNSTNNKTSFIWDTSEDDDQQQQQQQQHSTTRNNSLQQFSNNVTNGNQSSSMITTTSTRNPLAAQNTSSAAIQAVNELKEKLAQIKDNIITKTNQLKDLHQELVRIDNARDKRKDKLQQKWEAKLTSIRREQREVLQHQQDTYIKLVQELKELNKKIVALNERQHQFQDNQTVILDKAQRGAYCYNNNYYYYYDTSAYMYTTHLIYVHLGCLRLDAQDRPAEGSVGKRGKSVLRNGTL